MLSTDLLATSTFFRPDSTRNFMRNLSAYGFTEETVSNLAASCDEFGDFADCFFSHPVKINQKSMWVEKTPTNAYCIQEFLSLYPFGRYVHVVRDGRDVVPSLVKRGYSTEAAVRRWLHDTAAGYPHRKSKRYMEIKYEDLVTNPEHTLDALFDFLGVDERSNSILATYRNRNGISGGSKTWTFDPHQAISTAALHKWKRPDYGHKAFLEQLFRHTYLANTVAEAWGIPRPCNGNDLLSLLGYDVSDTWNVKPTYGRRFLYHYLVERICQLLRHRELYCLVCIS